MISRDAAPIAHVWPRPPIELNPRPDRVTPSESWTENLLDALAANNAKIEADRIWKLVVQASEGGGGGSAPVAPADDFAPSEYVAPANDLA